ncbi:hypothetical protein [Pseudomonas sp. Marseille-P9899]|uniref:hypothetical protein n=1 Tax=Pseudomonas sp. Marseille-P9899 TaxID=2730401 RepID=UPI00158E1E91|nr:hypothetical protein [Pseudomonas sp. Marseille-P9899]
MSTFEIHGGNDRRSMMVRFERKSKQAAVSELVDLIQSAWRQNELLEIERDQLKATTAATAVHDLDKAEGEQPDLNFHLLQIAERSCSLLEDWAQLAGVRDETLTDQIKETRALLETQRPTWSVGAKDLLTERRRQVRVEGYTLEHDDQYTEGQLAEAASSYAFWAEHCEHYPENLDDLRIKPPATWPWAPEHWKPTSQRLMLIKAGALILAELERLDRLESREAHHD